jgi:hypothetical protein
MALGATIDLSLGIGLKVERLKVVPRRGSRRVGSEGKLEVERLKVKVKRSFLICNLNLLTCNSSRTKDKNQSLNRLV